LDSGQNTVGDEFQTLKRGLPSGAKGLLRKKTIWIAGVALKVGAVGQYEGKNVPEGGTIKGRRLKLCGPTMKTS